jgi:lysophospholipase L1-like esterase
VGLGFLLLALAARAAAGVQVVPTDRPPAVRALPVRVVGRAVRDGGEWIRQWPATAFETAFDGREAWFRVGRDEAILAVSVDGREAARLARPGTGLYRVGGLRPGRHRLRVEVVTESQKEPTRFGGFFASGATRAVLLARPRRAIEFIGDSHTVGYANASAKRECTGEEIWSTTDSTRAVPALIARRYAADVAVNAISGRGVVRNYGGEKHDLLPEAYLYALLDHRFPWRRERWRPQLILVALGTNDFSTPLHAGEKWTDRQALRADFEAHYLRFLRSLRAADPGAFLLIWIADTGDGEIAREAGRVASRMAESGERRIAFVPVSGLALSACDWHPSLADDRRIAAALAGAIDARRDIWTPPPPRRGERLKP